MKPAFTDEQTIDAAPDAVWTALTDWDGARHWMPGVESMRADGPLVVGTVLHFVARGKERTSTITAIEPGLAVTMRSAVGGVTADYAYTIEPSHTDAAGSRVRLDAAVGTRGVMTLLAPVIRSAIAREDGAQLTRLKAWVEGAVSPAHPE
ncbi:SRPBCC family protein [Agromyces sp. NPDC058484]|uniref:SRPBCC family protein n=1 Tax=Agromyces sp. NPDC058484 TaxID=3346524 RepID=UPI003654EE3F